MERTQHRALLMAILMAPNDLAHADTQQLADLVARVGSIADVIIRDCEGQELRDLPGALETILDDAAETNVARGYGMESIIVGKPLGFHGDTPDDDHPVENVLHHDPAMLGEHVDPSYKDLLRIARSTLSAIPLPVSDDITQGLSVAEARARRIKYNDRYVTVATNVAAFAFNVDPSVVTSDQRGWAIDLLRSRCNQTFWDDAGTTPPVENAATQGPAVSVGSMSNLERFSQMLDEDAKRAGINGKRRPGLAPEQFSKSVATEAESDDEDEGLLCPTDYESATGHFDPAGYDANDCAGCGMPKSKHTRAPEAVTKEDDEHGPHPYEDLDKGDDMCRICGRPEGDDIHNPDSLEAISDEFHAPDEYVEHDQRTYRISYGDADNKGNVGPLDIAGTTAANREVTRLLRECGHGKSSDFTRILRREVRNLEVHSSAVHGNASRPFTITRVK